MIPHRDDPKCRCFVCNTWPKIDGKLLEASDVGRNVTYTTSRGEKHQGRLSSFRDDGAIFVRFKGPGGERCPQEKLTWG